MQDPRNHNPGFLLRLMPLAPYQLISQVPGHGPYLNNNDLLYDIIGSLLSDKQGLELGNFLADKKSSHIPDHDHGWDLPDI